MSKEERKKRENEQIKILNNIINKKSHFESLDPLKKALEYTSLLNQLEYNLKYYPEEDKNKKYYREYLEEIEKLYESLAEIYFNEKQYKKSIEFDKKILKRNDKYHKSFKRLYFSYWALGDKETAVIYGSFLLSKVDKKIQNKYYKDLIPIVKTNLLQVAKDFKNKSWWSGLKITKGMIIRGIIFIICIIYFIRNYKDLNLVF